MRCALPQVAGWLTDAHRQSLLEGHSRCHFRFKSGLLQNCKRGRYCLSRCLLAAKERDGVSAARHVVLLCLRRAPGVRRDGHHQRPRESSATPAFCTHQADAATGVPSGAISSHPPLCKGGERGGRSPAPAAPPLQSRPCSPALAAPPCGRWQSTFVVTPPPEWQRGAMQGAGDRLDVYVKEGVTVLLEPSHRATLQRTRRGGENAASHASLLCMRRTPRVRKVGHHHCPQESSATPACRQAPPPPLAPTQADAAGRCREGAISSPPPHKLYAREESGEGAAPPLQPLPCIPPLQSRACSPARRAVAMYICCASSA